MVLVVACKRCSWKSPNDIVGEKRFKYSGKTGVFYCPHVTIFKRTIKTVWEKFKC